MERITVYTDGASRGNPGHAGIGVVIVDNKGNLLKEISDYIGETTNNIAEYTALITGLKEVREMEYDEVEVVSDSELMVKQINGEYQVKNVGLKKLYDQAKEIISGFKSFSIRHVRRGENKRADELANQGIDYALDDDEEILL